MKLQRQLALASLLVLIAGLAPAATIFEIPTDAQMVRESSAIVVGTVLSAHSRRAPDGMIETVTTLALSEVLKGKLDPSKSLEIVDLGGFVGDRGLIVPGSPAWQPGERALIFLARNARGEWTTRDLAFGKFAAGRGAGGEGVLTRSIDGIHIEKDRGSETRSGVRSEARFLSWIRQVVAGGSPHVDYTAKGPASPVTPSHPGPGLHHPSHFLYYFGNPPANPLRPTRRTAFDVQGGSLNVFRVGSQNGVADSTGLLTQALVAWSNPAYSSVRLNDAGLAASTVTAAVEDNVNAVIFNDPTDQIPSSSTFLALTFFWVSGTENTFKNETFYTLPEADIVVQAGIAATNFGGLLTHEVGHLLGFRHSNGNSNISDAPSVLQPQCPDAVMAFPINGTFGLTLQPWDQIAVNAAYGAPAEVALTGPAITTQPLSQTIASGQTATLTVRAGGTSLTYQWYEGASGVTTTPVTGATASSYTTPSLSASASYWVRISGTCGFATDSATATITIGAPAPTVTSIVPSSGPAAGGTDVRINGSNFPTSGLTVAFGATAVTNVTWLSSTALSATSPAGTGTVSVRVTVNGQTSADTAGDDFTYVAAPSCPAFASAANFAAGPTPLSVAIGDFNGDGRRDLAVANVTSNISILLGTGPGTFGAATNLVVGGNAYSVAIGDFNGDSRSDLAVANESSNNVSILLGSGTGTFSPASNFNVGTTPRSVAVGDFNGDGRSDLAVANYNSDSVSILAGTGTGTFGEATNLVVGRSPISVAIGDFNGDGRSDLAIANSGSANVTILTGTGSGTFGTATNLAVGRGPSSVAIGDFNGDGRSDLAVANASSNNVSILLGTVTGTFVPATNFAVGLNPVSVAIGDFNSDGRSDLAVSSVSSNEISILPGMGTGTFGVATNFTVEGDSLSVAIGDFNSDGRSDLAVGVTNVARSFVSILLNSCPVTAAQDVQVSYKVSVSLELSGVTSTQAAAFENQFKNVLVTALGVGVNRVLVTKIPASGKLALNGVPSPSHYKRALHEGISSNPPGDLLNFPVGANPVFVAIGDCNSDGRNDLVVANRDSNDVSILLGSGVPGNFGSATNFAVGTGPLSVAIGDFNVDGRNDLAVANSLSNNVSILFGSGTGTFAPATNFPVGIAPQSVAIGDFNSDGRSDLAVANQGSSDVSILLGSGTGTFGAATSVPAGSAPRSLEIADFNTDGRSDLAVANSGSNNVSILLGSGTGTFGAATNLPVGSAPQSLVIDDFNADGRKDLVVANSGSNNVSILLGTGIGTFSAATNVAVGTNPRSVTVGDFNSDGKSDLAVANITSGTVSILLNVPGFDPDGNGSTSVADVFYLINFLFTNGAGPVGSGDANGDATVSVADVFYLINFLFAGGPAPR